MDSLAFTKLKVIKIKSHQTSSFEQAIREALQLAVHE